MDEEGMQRTWVRIQEDESAWWRHGKVSSPSIFSERLEMVLLAEEKVEGVRDPCSLTQTKNDKALHWSAVCCWSVPTCSALTCDLEVRVVALALGLLGAKCSTCFPSKSLPKALSLQLMLIHGKQ